MSFIGRGRGEVVRKAIGRASVLLTSFVAGVVASCGTYFGRLLKERGERLDEAFGVFEVEMPIFDVL